MTLAAIGLGLAASAFLGFELFRQVGGPTYRQAGHQRRVAARGGELRQAAGVTAEGLNTLAITSEKAKNCAGRHMPTLGKAKAERHPSSPDTPATQPRANNKMAN
jgi:hypothetical protein